MTAPVRAAVAAATVFLFLTIVIAAAASAVAASLTNPLSRLWHAVTTEPAKTQTVWSTGDYLTLIATAEHDASTPQAAAAIAFAAAQIGHPYIWGGTGINNSEAGYDCSGLTQAAYRYAGIDIPRVATGQYKAEAKVELGSLLPGDLAFYGNPAFAHHVAIYLGTIRGVPTVVDAPAPGEVVRLDPLRAGDLFAAARPTDPPPVPPRTPPTIPPPDARRRS